MTKDEALKLALEALEKSHTCPLLPDDCAEAITAIKEALAQQEQEPVCDKDPQGCWNVRCQLGKKCKNTPPQRKPLSDEEIILIVAECASSHQHTDIHFARAIEAAHGIKRLV